MNFNKLAAHDIIINYCARRQMKGKVKYNIALIFPLPDLLLKSLKLGVSAICMISCLLVYTPVFFPLFLIAVLTTF